MGRITQARLAELKQELIIKPTSYEYYQRLAAYHYVTQKLYSYKYIFGIFPRLPYHNKYPHPVAVAVYSPPLPNIQARRTALEGILDIPRDRKESLQVVNRHIIYAARLIVDPRYECIGLGTWLTSHICDTLDYPVTEALTPADGTDLLMKRCGFEQHYNPAPSYYARVTRSLYLCGIVPELYKHPRLVNLRIESLSPPLKSNLLYELQRFVNHFRHRHASPHSEERTQFILQKLFYPHVYHVRIRDGFPENQSRGRDIAEISSEKAR